MEGGRIFKTIVKGWPLSHWPSVMLLIGYPVFWLEMAGGWAFDGQTTPLAAGLLAGVTIARLWRDRGALGAWVRTLGARWRAMPVGTRRLGLVFGLAAVGLLGVALNAALLPPHLIQESDALNYHYTLPRQHLIIRSFRHISWAADDLFLLPVQFALAPFWFVTALPNKVPQWFFLVGLLAILMKLARRWSGGDDRAAVLTGLAVLGAHHVGVQMGTAMLDLVLAYLLFAALDSFQEGRWLLGTLEASFLLWSKSFMPVQLGLVGLAMALACWAARAAGWHVEGAARIHDLWRRKGRRILAAFGVGGLVIGGPFLAKATYYSGTPVFPILTGIVPWPRYADSPAHWQSIQASSSAFVRVARGYGEGRSFGAFLRHLWIVAVPTRGVNNAYDYPLGLVYLLVLGPFMGQVLRAARRKTVALGALFIGASWGLWWFGSQQSRYLYGPVLLMTVLVLADRSWRRSPVLAGCLLAAVGLTAVSVTRSHRPDWGRPALAVLRQKDRDVLMMNQVYQRTGRRGFVDLTFRDTPFARFPIRAVKEQLPHTLAVDALN